MRKRVTSSILSVDVGVDQVVGEHAAAGQELAILVEVVERHVERAAHRRDLLVLLGRQVVEVLVGGVARVDLVLHAVQAGHQHRGEREVGVRGRVREADLDAAALRVADVGNADRRGAVARGVRELDRRLEARHQPLVRVRARVGDRIERARVLDDAADVVQRELRQARVAVAGEQVLAVLPHRLVDVHAGAVVADDGLGHEGGRLAVRGRGVVDDVLQDLQPVAALDQRREAGADLALPGGGDLVVVHLDLDAHLLEREAHRGADVLQRVDRGHREVAALHRRPVAQVAALELVGRGPGRFLGEDLAVAARHVDVPLDGVEDEELGLGTEVGDVAEAGGLEVGLGALGERARVALVALAVGRLHDVAGDVDGRLVHEGIDDGRVRIRHQQHVGGLDALPSGDRRAVERVARLELVDAEVLRRHRDVLLLAARVGETEIDELDVLLLEHLEDVGAGRGHGVSLSWLVVHCENAGEEIAKPMPVRERHVSACPCIAFTGPLRCSAARFAPPLCNAGNLRAIEVRIRRALAAACTIFDRAMGGRRGRALPFPCGLSRSRAIRTVSVRSSRSYG